MEEIKKVKLTQDQESKIPAIKSEKHEAHEVMEIAKAAAANVTATAQSIAPRVPEKLEETI